MVFELASIIRTNVTQTILLEFGQKTCQFRTLGRWPDRGVMFKILPSTSDRVLVEGNDDMHADVTPIARSNNKRGKRLNRAWRSSFQ